MSGLWTLKHQMYIASVNKGVTQWSPPSTPCHTSRYSMVYRGCSKEYLHRAKINVFFSLYQFSPTKYQDIEKILSDSESL